MMHFGPGHLELKDLYLVELRRHGATIQPVFAYIEPISCTPRIDLVGPSHPYVHYGFR